MSEWGLASTTFLLDSKSSRGITLAMLWMGLL